MDEVKPIQADWTVSTVQLPTVNEKQPTIPSSRKQPYYRSKAFISQIGVNPLIAAAAPLFFLVEKFQYHEKLTGADFIKLREDVLHEMRAFEQQALGHQYRPTMLQAARYILCLWIDEMILNTRWGRESEWVEHRMVDHLPMDIHKEKSFFLLLTQCMQEPTSYLELLELFYLCLSLGFEGEYRYLERGHILLAEIRDNLYHLIQTHRGEISKQLEVKLQHAPATEKFAAKLWVHVAVLASAAVVTLAAYFFMNHLLNRDVTVAKNIFEQSEGSA